MIPGGHSPSHAHSLACRYAPCDLQSRLAECYFFLFLVALCNVPFLSDLEENQSAFAAQTHESGRWALRRNLEATRECGWGVVCCEVWGETYAMESGKRLGSHKISSGGPPNTGGGVELPLAH